MKEQDIMPKIADALTFLGGVKYIMFGMVRPDDLRSDGPGRSMLDMLNEVEYNLEKAKKILECHFLMSLAKGESDFPDDSPGGMKQ